MGANGNKVRDSYAEEVEFLTSCGVTPLQIPTRLGVKPPTLNRALYRAGRPELARLFGPEVTRSRKRTCQHCGGPCDQKYNRCFDCRWKAAS